MHAARTAARAAALLFSLAGSLAATLHAQQPRQYTDADYAQAEKFMGYNMAPLAYKGLVHPHWIDDTRFYYRDVDTDSRAITYMLVDPATGTRKPAFDQTALAAALAAASNGKIKNDPQHLELTDLSLSDHDTQLAVSVGRDEVKYRCTLGATGHLHPAASRRPRGAHALAR